jgi:hypothetical protein
MSKFSIIVFLLIIIVNSPCHASEQIRFNETAFIEYFGHTIADNINSPDFTMVILKKLNQLNNQQLKKITGGLDNNINELRCKIFMKAIAQNKRIYNIHTDENFTSVIFREKFEENGPGIQSIVNLNSDQGEM